MTFYATTSENGAPVGAELGPSGIERARVEPSGAEWGSSGYILESRRVVDYKFVVGFESESSRRGVGGIGLESKSGAEWGRVGPSLSCVGI